MTRITARWTQYGPVAHHKGRRIAEGDFWHTVAYRLDMWCDNNQIDKGSVTFNDDAYGKELETHFREYAAIK